MPPDALSQAENIFLFVHHLHTADVIADLGSGLILYFAGHR